MVIGKGIFEVKMSFSPLFARVGVSYKGRKFAQKEEKNAFFDILLKLISEVLLKKEERMHHPKFFTVQKNFYCSKKKFAGQKLL